MAKKESGDEALRCSFCNKSQREVKKLIAGPTVFICDECVDICLDIIAEDRLHEQQQETDLPKPEEIKAMLDVTEFQTVAGPIKFVKGENVATPGMVGQWQKGEFEIVWPKSLATGTAVVPKPAWA